eukprot:scaffold6894_cov21-Tisochrysis_lutea.AAC.2
MNTSLEAIMKYSGFTPWHDLSSSFKDKGFTPWHLHYLTTALPQICQQWHLYFLTSEAKAGINTPPVHHAVSLHIRPHASVPCAATPCASIA